MSIIATAVKHLIAAGVSGDDLVRAIAEMEAAQPVKLDPVAEKRRAYDRERKRNRDRNSDGIPVESAAPPPPNDIYSNPPPVTPTANAVDPLSDFSDRVVEDWNRQIAGTPLPQARKLNADRRKHLRCRVAEHGESAVLAAIGAMCRSDFHSGRSGKWTEGSLGWLLKSPENFQKMLERADGEAAKPAAAAKSSIAGGSLFDQLREGKITEAEFHAQRAKLAQTEKPPPRRDKPQTGSIAQFIPRIAGAA
ncbi:hypothetical protein [Sphingobium sp. WCS2017Hpa-17]|uniref:hypothetical protein n=1 Tax=Sphingobium sp. WCS2017Hpa-17 TaxID=3073638 RepID=UPI002889E120|nr:hypothetical protein [Sphingobium sp. WCS2017Hpa-17]